MNRPFAKADRAADIQVARSRIAYAMACRVAEGLLGLLNGVRRLQGLKAADGRTRGRRSPCGRAGSGVHGDVAVVDDDGSRVIGVQPTPDDAAERKARLIMSGLPGPKRVDVDGEGPGNHHRCCDPAPARKAHSNRGSRFSTKASRASCDSRDR